MAASKPSGGIETTLQFPLYLYFDYCGEMWGYETCDAWGDFTELHRYLTECITAYGVVDDYGNIEIFKDSISQVGEIYIEDVSIYYLCLDIRGELAFYAGDWAGYIYADHIWADRIIEL